MNKEIKKGSMLSMLFVSACFVVLFGLILFSGELVKGQKFVLHLTGTIPMALITAIIFAAVTRHLVNKAKLEQYLEDTIRSNRIHEAEKKDFLEKIKQYEGLTDLYYDIREKLNASQIYEVPILGAYLLEKKVLLKHEQGIEVEFELDGNFSVLNQIDAKDLIDVIDDSVSRIVKMQGEYGNKTDLLNITTYEENGHFVIDLFTFVDYNNTSGRDSATLFSVNNEQFVWNMKKIVNKYKADIEVVVPEHGKDEKNFTSIIRIKFPKEAKGTSTIKRIG